MKSNIIVYICQNCVPEGGNLPRQWTQDSTTVQVRQIPCSGKIDGQYLMHALEDNARGLLVVTCPKGDCHLVEGNYRALVRIQTAKRLLNEIGIEPERVELKPISKENHSQVSLKQTIDEAVSRFLAYGKSPLEAVS